MDDRSYLSLTLGELQTLSEPGELSGALHAVRTRYGLSHMTFIVVRRGAGPSAAPYYCSTYPEEWIATYFANDYLAIDPVIDIARWGLLPVDWSTLDQRASRVRRLFDEARAYGVGPNGLTVPIRGANGERCLFSVTSEWSGSDWLALCAANLHDLHILSHYLHEKVLTLSGLRRPFLSENYRGENANVSNFLRPARSINRLPSSWASRRVRSTSICGRPGGS